MQPPARNATASWARASERRNRALLQELATLRGVNCGSQTRSAAHRGGGPRGEPSWHIAIWAVRVYPAIRERRREWRAPAAE